VTTRDLNRDLNKEYQDKSDRKYAYEFDYVLRDFMIRDFKPLFISPESSNQISNTLEMGCYKGEFTQKISPYFDTISVMEGSSELVKYCQDKFEQRPELVNHKNIYYFNQRFEDATLDQSFDNIFLIHTLEHLDEPIEILKRINQWLTKSGRLFLAVPNANAASRQIAVNMGLISHNAAVTEGEKEHGHRRTYSLDTLRRDATKSGLKIVREGGVFFKPFANFQFDQIIKEKIVNLDYLDGCYQLGQRYPDLCASVYLVCEKG